MSERAILASSMKRRSPGEGAIFRRKDGRWVAVLEAGYAGGRRRRRHLYGKTKAEVRERLAEAVAVKGASGFLPSDRLTVRSFLDRWLEDVVRPGARPSTLRGYESIVRVHLIPALGRIPLAKLSPADVQTYLVDARRSGLAGQTIAHHRAVLRRALAQALRWGLVVRNAAALTEPPRVERQEVRPLTAEQARSFLADTSGDRVHALYVVALSTGLRQGELLGLTWRSVDLEAAELTVRLSLQRIGGQAMLVEPKTQRSRRRIALPGIAVSALRDHRRRQLEERLAAGSRWHDQDLVFCTVDGRALHGTSVTKAFQQALERIGLPRQRFHDLRHAAASLLIAEGVPARVVMETLGHSSIKLTMDTYGHVVPQQSREAAERMDRALGGGKV